MLKQSLSIFKQLGSLGKCKDATDLLPEDLVMVEQRVEPAKKAVQVLHRKLQGCLQSQQGLDSEKRVKKLPLMLLSLSMAETLKDFDHADSPFRRVLEMCCFMENRLANILANFEVKLEKEVLEPLSKLSEEDLPEILKNKKQFAKLTTDWQNARNKSQASTGAQAKQDCLREDVEEAWRRLETIKDQYSADLYHFATKEDSYANYFIQLLELQADYHKESHEFLNRSIMELKENHNQKEPQLSQGKVFGEPLLSHLSESGRGIAVPIQECVHMLLHTAMTEEGLFRLTAAASVVKTLKSCLDRGTVDHAEFNTEPHAVAGVLKCYLRELPEPLMTSELYNDWFKAAGEKELTEKLEQFRVVLRKLPPVNYNNLRYLIQFLSCLSEQQAVNKMTPRNIAIVLGPNLLWPHTEGEAALLDMASASSVQVVSVIEPLIQYSRSLFPEEVDFEIPDLPEAPQPLESRKEGLSRTTSLSSTASSSSSVHTPLSKTSSSASQDSTYALRSPGSVSRKTTTWESPPSDPPGPNPPSPVQKQNSSPVLSPAQVSNLSPVSSPTLAQRPQQFFSTTSVPSPNPVPVASSIEKQSSDPGQLETISEVPPDSPRVTLKINLPFKPTRRSFVHRAPAQGMEQVVAYSKLRASVECQPSKPQAPTPLGAQAGKPQPQPHPRVKPQAPTPLAAQAGEPQPQTQPPVEPQAPAPLMAQAGDPQPQPHPRVKPQVPTPLAAQAGEPQPQTQPPVEPQAPAPLMAQAGDPQPQPHPRVKPQVPTPLAAQAGEPQPQTQPPVKSQAPPLKKPPPRKPGIRPPKAPPPLPPLVDSKQECKQSGNGV